MADADGPLGADDVDRLLAPLEGARGVALAVSGGPDSTALLILAAAWTARRPEAPPILVLTVDHGLRPESAAEAAAVAAQAIALGLRHRTLAWTGDKPSAGIQEAARRARYRLLAEAAAAAGADLLVTAHTADDQAETVLLNLARGSGVYGLAAMPRARRLDGVTLLRPFLDVPKSRLIATLKAQGVAWMEDPSNANPQFKRVAVRRALADLAGLGLTRDRLADTARRLARAAAAIDHAVGRLIAEAGLEHPGGFARIDERALAAAPEEVRLRALARLLRHAGGGDYPPRLERLEALAAALGEPGRLKRTLGGAVVERIGAAVWFYRELGRHGAAVLRLAPGQFGVFDDRFHVMAPATLAGPFEIAPLGLSAARGLGEVDVPPRVLATMPAARLDGEVIGLPGALGGRADVVFEPLGPDRAAPSLRAAVDDDRF